MAKSKARLNANAGNTRRAQVPARSGISWHARGAAAWAGWRDARSGLWTDRLRAYRDQVLDGAPRGRQYSPDRPSYQVKLQRRANRAAHLRKAEILSANERLAIEVYAVARAVVDAAGAGTVADAHRLRLEQSLARWRTRATAHGEWADAITDAANEQLECYWEAVRRWHARQRAKARRRESPQDERYRAVVDLSAWRPESITLDPAWPSPLELLMKSPASAHARTVDEDDVLVRALEILNVNA